MTFINAPQVSRRQIEFAEKAAAFFSKCPDCCSFTEGEIEYGELFALRWGGGQDCVLIFEIGGSPLIFAQFTNKEAEEEEHRG